MGRVTDERLADVVVDVDVRERVPGPGPGLGSFEVSGEFLNMGEASISSVADVADMVRFR